MNLMSAHEVAHLYKTTRSYVYKLASKHRWRRIRHNGTTFYNQDDVDRDLGK